MNRFIRNWLHRVLWSIGFLLAAKVAEATETGDPSSGSTMMVLLVGLAFLLIAAVCTLAAFKVYVSLRGGKLALSWRWFVAGFGLLGLSQMVLFASQAGFLSLTLGWVELTRVLALALILIGLNRVRKLIS
jgi:hypothetical protein